MYQEYFSIQLTPKISLGIPLEHMGVVIQLEFNQICPIPGVAEFWYGVANHKGSLLWVLDSDRYFGIHQQKNALQRKFTAVILKNQLVKSSRQVAIVVQKLVGINQLEIHNVTEDNTKIASTLKNCCSPSIITEDRSTYILNPDILLQQLQQSTLVSA